MAYGTTGIDGDRKTENDVERCKPTYMMMMRRRMNPL